MGSFGDKQHGLQGSGYTMKCLPAGLLFSVCTLPPLGPVVKVITYLLFKGLFYYFKLCVFVCAHTCFHMTACPAKNTSGEHIP